MAIIWKAPDDVHERLTALRQAYHLPRLTDARFAVAFTDSKPFIKNRFNWGKVVRFSEFNRLYHHNPAYDFSVVICADIWHGILNDAQRDGYLDVQLTRCTAEYEPEVVIEGNKKKVVKDDWGRIKYTNQIKLDDEGKPKWKVEPLDLEVIAKNILRFGVWMTPFLSQVASDLLEEAEKQE